jgi:hypothetical protein
LVIDWVASSMVSHLGQQAGNAAHGAISTRKILGTAEKRRAASV